MDEQWSYSSAVGMLLYLASNTRPDIQFAVHQVARFSHNPKHSHAQAVKRIVWYLAGTKDKGIQFEPNLKAGLDCYVDTDFAAELYFPAYRGISESAGMPEYRLFRIPANNSGTIPAIPVPELTNGISRNAP